MVENIICLVPYKGFYSKPRFKRQTNKKQTVIRGRFSQNIVLSIACYRYFSEVFPEDRFSSYGSSLYSLDHISVHTFS